MNTRHLALLASLPAALILLGGCGREAAPPAATEAARGTVAVDNAGAAENPETPALSGGPEGQTPDYPAPGGAPSVVYSDKVGTTPPAGGDNPH